ncbi:FxSxx-COOH system tetratricopeptide repeat protein [Streptomyces sp. NPDC013455]|uniref:FxSxx-COOH system tetratricopeptide repeat protein n=1 Tax=Streptomyces sp. NPDC013455 TaxID=3155605 RepID=UPI0033DE9887
MTARDSEPDLRIEAPGDRSIAAQRIGAAISGDVLPAEALYAPQRVAAAPGTSNLPAHGLCVGRESELAWLRRTLTGQRESAITQSGTVHGLGGVGKSTLALHYAFRHRGDHSLIWWINAASPDAIEQSLTELTHRLVPEWAARAPREAQVAWAMQWLSWHPGWLLVYDNVEDPADLAPYTGSLNNGHHLATSRRTRGWPDSAPTLSLGNLDPDHATDLLCTLVFKDTAPSARQVADARALAADLGYLPLALKQAGAYLAQNRGVTFDAYRRSLGTKLHKNADGVAAEQTIARVWQVGFRTLALRDPLAVDVLYTAAWLAPDDIPHTLLALPGTDPATLAEAVGTLAAYSMATDTGTTISVHRLVQAVLRAPHEEGDRRPEQGRERAEQALLRAFARAPGQGPVGEARWEALTPHLIALAATTPAGRHNASLTDAYNITARRLYERGHAARAIPLLEASLAQLRHTLGDTHPETLTSRNNLGYAYRDAGDVKRAIPLLETTLAQRREVLSEVHPSTLISCNNLGYAYRLAGLLRQAIPLLEACLERSEQVLGELDPTTLNCRNNLAGAYRDAGDLKRAIPLLETTLAQREEVLGDTHRDTLTSRNELAGAYRDAGDLKRAIPLLETTLTQCEQVLGDTHPSTLTARNNLASTYRQAGQLERAITLLEATLAQREQVLGDTHPSTLTSRNNLASAYRRAGQLERAIALFEATLAQREQILGDTHPSTLISRNNLASALREAGDLPRATALYETALGQLEQVLGDSHHHTVVTRNNLAAARRALRDVQRASTAAPAAETRRLRP